MPPAPMHGEFTAVQKIAEGVVDLAIHSARRLSPGGITSVSAGAERGMAQEAVGRFGGKLKKLGDEHPGRDPRLR